MTIELTEEQLSRDINEWAILNSDRGTITLVDDNHDGVELYADHVAMLIPFLKERLPLLRLSPKALREQEELDKIPRACPMYACQLRDKRLHKNGIPGCVMCAGTGTVTEAGKRLDWCPAAMCQTRGPVTSCVACHGTGAVPRGTPAP